MVKYTTTFVYSWKKERKINLDLVWSKIYHIISIYTQRCLFSVEDYYYISTIPCSVSTAVKSTQINACTF